jgi:hypothetical protein
VDFVDGVDLYDRGSGCRSHDYAGQVGDGPSRSRALDSGWDSGSLAARSAT